MKILILEDDREIANLVQMGLTSAGFEVEVAHDGNSGLELARLRDISGQ